MFEMSLHLASFFGIKKAKTQHRGIVFWNPLPAHTVWNMELPNVYVVIRVIIFCGKCV